MMDSDQAGALFAALQRANAIRGVLLTTTDLLLALVASRCELARAPVTGTSIGHIVRAVLAAGVMPADGVEWINLIDAHIASLPPSIVCPHCKSVSYNPEDVANRYCPRCHVFHEARP
jgi:hypothetical protein